MSEKSTNITSDDGRSRVAYEMALRMWHSSNASRSPKVEDQDEFLKLVERCLSALAYD